VDASVFILRQVNEEQQEFIDEYTVEHGVRVPRGAMCSPATLENEPYLALSVEQRKEIIIDNISEHHEKQALKRLVSNDEAMNSLVCIPLLVEDRLIGVVSVQSQVHDAYSAYHLDIIRALASYTAIALDNARAYKSVQDLNMEKNLLLGVVAHDLKTPLSGIILAASNVENYFERMSREQVLQRVKSIQQSAFNMARFIEDLLDVSAIESGKIRLHPENISLEKLLPRLIEQQREQAAMKKIHILFYGTDETIRAFADSQRTEQIFDNLLSNAIKFSPFSANVYVSVWGANSSQTSTTTISEQSNTQAHFLSHTVAVRDTMVFFAVRDEGPGISEDDRKNLFGKFSRLSARPTAGEHSSGLGLAIVKRLVEAMGGQVWCESALGEGATFFVALPCAVKQA
jgi:signal transduction histidine kinase